MLGIFGGCIVLALLFLIGAAILISRTTFEGPDGQAIPWDRVLLRFVLIGLLVFFAVALIWLPMQLQMERGRGELVGIPDKHCMVLFVHGQKRFVIQGSSYRSQPKLGETYKLYDLREQIRSVTNSCDTSDQARVNVECDIHWHHLADYMFIYLDSAGDPLAAIEKAVKSEITSQFGQRDHTRALGDLKAIASLVTSAVKDKCLQQYGINILTVTINSAKQDVAVTPDKQEASHITTIDKVARNISDKTMDYLKMKEGKNKDKE
jgi:hypothetical protein